MQVSFVRTAGARDRVYVRRTSGSEVSWEFPSYGDELPHDLVHLVVEEAFGLRGGFWGRVDAGIDPTRINAEANRKGGKLAEKYAGFGPDLDGLLQAEALAALPWLDVSVDGFELGRRLAALGYPEAPITHVRARLVMLRGRWRALGAKGTLQLSFALPP